MPAQQTLSITLIFLHLTPSGCCATSLGGRLSHPIARCNLCGCMHAMTLRTRPSFRPLFAVGVGVVRACDSREGAAVGAAGPTLVSHVVSGLQEQ